jgi:hypothetical protein
MHPGRLHSGRQSFGNWRGFACPGCNAEIPCLWNVFSLSILLVTFPIWVPPYYLYFCGKPLRPMFRFENGKPPTLKAVTARKWAALGAVWRGLLWLLMCFVPALNGKTDAHLREAATLGSPVCTAGGFYPGSACGFSSGEPQNKRVRDDNTRKCARSPVREHF